MNAQPPQTPTIEAGQIIPLEHRTLEAILFVDTPHTPAKSGVEIRVALRDGRTFGFTVYTPVSLTRIMNDSGQSSVVDVGMIIVNQITLDAVLDALERMLSSGIERFGLAL